MTDGSDGDDRQPSGSDAAPESSDGDTAPDADDSVTPGVDAGEASEPSTPASTAASADGGTTDDGGGFEKVPDEEWENRATPGGERTGHGHRNSQSVADEGESVADDSDGSDAADATEGRETAAEGESESRTDSESQIDSESEAPTAPTADELDPTASTDRDLAGVADERLPDGVTDERESAGESETTDERVQQTDGDPGHASTVQPEAAFDARAGMEAGTGTEAEPTADAAPAAPPAEAEPDTLPAAEAGTGAVGEGGTVGEPETGVIEEEDGGLFGGDGPQSDEEMPLTEHIEEMMRRLGVVFAVGGVVTLGVLVAGNLVPAVPNAEEIITFLWDAHVNFDNYRPYVYGPLELLLTKLKVAGLAGVVIALPVFVYQTYRFMRPGLYPHERRYYLAAVPTSLVLAVIGVAFAHFFVLPAIFQYFISYTKGSANLAFGLRETFNLILLLMGYMAVVFQIPLFVQLSIMMGVVTREWLEQRRLLFWGSFLGLSFLVSPDPTGMSPIIVATTMVVLFEGTLALLRWTGN